MTEEALNEAGPVNLFSIFPIKIKLIFPVVYSWHLSSSYSKAFWLSPPSWEHSQNSKQSLERPVPFHNLCGSHWHPSPQTVAFFPNFHLSQKVTSHTWQKPAFCLATRVDLVHLPGLKRWVLPSTFPWGIFISLSHKTICLCLSTSFITLNTFYPAL